MKKKILGIVVIAALLSPAARAADLFVAVFQGPAEVRTALAEGAPVNGKNEQGMTPLEMAVYSGKTDVIRLLLENGADANIANKQGTTPLSAAILTENVELVRLMIEHGAQVNTKDGNGTPLIHFPAYMKENKEIFDMLLEHGADINAVSKKGFSVLSGAIFAGNVAAAETLFKRGAKLPAGPEQPLLKAILQADEKAAKAAIEQGAPVDGKEHLPIFYAAGLGRAGIVRLLLDKGVKPDVQESSSGVTPLYTAAGAGHVETVKLLLERGADPNHSAKEAGEPTYAAALQGRREALAVLLDKGGKLDLNKDRGYRMTTWDIVTMQAGGGETLQALKDRGVKFDVNRKNIHGQDALTLAISMKNLGMTRFLMENGADISTHYADLLNAGAMSGETEFIRIAAAKGFRPTEIEGTVALSFAKNLRPEKRPGVLSELQGLGVKLDEQALRDLNIPKVLEAEKAGDASLAAGRASDALLDYVKALRSVELGTDLDERVRRKAIKAAAGLRPPLPEEVNRRTVRAETFIEQAKSPEDFQKAASELDQASRVAPWEPGIYYNLGLVQEKAEDFAGAIRSMKWYLAADPQAKDAAAVKNKIYKLEAQQEMAGKN